MSRISNVDSLIKMWRTNCHNSWKTYNGLLEYQFYKDLKETDHNNLDVLHVASTFENGCFSCGNFVESTTHFFLHCTHFSNQRLTLINKIKDIDKRIFDKNDSLITQTLLFGDEKLSITDNKSILEATIQFLISSARFDSPLY